MPICEITYPNRLIDGNEMDIIVKKLTPILLKAEGLEDNKISRSLCLIVLNPSNSVYIGGERSDYGKIIVKINVFSGAYDGAIKAQLYSDITQLFITENTYTKNQNGNNIWCIIYPIENDNFGAGGIPVSLQMTKDLISEFQK